MKVLFISAIMATFSGLTLLGIAANLDSQSTVLKYNYRAHGLHKTKQAYNYRAHGMAHKCPYTLCPFKGLAQYKNVCGCEEGTDCQLLDSIHFAHPYDTYDQNEEMLFGK